MISPKAYKGQKQKSIQGLKFMLFPDYFLGWNKSIESPENCVKMLVGIAVFLWVILLASEGISSGGAKDELEKHTASNETRQKTTTEIQARHGASWTTAVAGEMEMKTEVEETRRENLSS